MTTMLPQMFDATQIAPNQGTPALPVGRHPVVITNVEIKATRAGDGGMIVFDLQITDGPSRGATGVMRNNFFSSSPQAAEIAKGQLSALGHATGVLKVQDLKAFINQPFMIDVELQRFAPGHPDAEKGYTQVQKILDRNGNEPGKSQNVAPQANAQAMQQPMQQPQQPMQQPQQFQQPQQPVQQPPQGFGQPMQQPQQQGTVPNNPASFGQPQQGQPPQGWTPPGGAATTPPAGSWGAPPQ
jgi:hypothetical protein